MHHTIHKVNKTKTLVQDLAQLQRTTNISTITVAYTAAAKSTHTAAGGRNVHKATQLLCNAQLVASYQDIGRYVSVCHVTHREGFYWRKWGGGSWWLVGRGAAGTPPV